jgi:hypothetical protein
LETVLYYSNDILSKSLPEFGPYVSLGITIVNVLMTFPPILLIEVCSHLLTIPHSDLGSAHGTTAVIGHLNFGGNNIAHTGRHRPQHRRRNPVEYSDFDLRNVRWRHQELENIV